MSDVFGSLVKQYTLGQTADQADWLIGAGLLAPRVTGAALRSMKAPGTAYDDDVLGKDPQPGDDGRLRPHGPRQRRRPHQLRHPQPRVLPARPPQLGGQAWERAGQIWYDVADRRRAGTQDAVFVDFATLTVKAAKDRYGEGDELEAVLKAWEQVGVRTL